MATPITPSSWASVSRIAASSLCQRTSSFSRRELVGAGFEGAWARAVAISSARHSKFFKGDPPEGIAILLCNCTMDNRPTDAHTLRNREQNLSLVGELEERDERAIFKSQGHSRREMLLKELSHCGIFFYRPLLRILAQDGA